MRMWRSARWWSRASRWSTNGGSWSVVTDESTTWRQPGTSADGFGKIG